MVYANTDATDATNFGGSSESKNVYKTLVGLFGASGFIGIGFLASMKSRKKKLSVVENSDEILTV